MKIGINSDKQTQSPSVVIVGGGLAGIAAAMRLAGRGMTVTLVETRKRLGGRATSFDDPVTGQVLDNCQHVLMGCCTNLIDLYRRLGVAQQIRWYRRLYFADGQGVIDQLEADDLPAPLHMTRSLLAFKSLAWSEKAAITRGMLAILRLGPDGRGDLFDTTFSHWLAQHGQPSSVVRKFWSVIVTSALNELPERASAAHAIQVFRDGFLASEHAYVMGLSAVPLVRLYDAARDAVTRAGGKVMLSTSADRFVFDGQRITALRLANGSELAADAFVSTVPFDRLDKLCSSSMRDADPRLTVLKRLTVSPIIGIHMWFENVAGRPLMTLPHLILTDSPLHWIFNKGHDEAVGGQHLHGVISAAHDLVDAPADQIIGVVTAEVRKALARRGGASARLLHARVIKEKRATFSVMPGIEKLRPQARGSIGNLYLAGDWCRTGWPATMEGAVRSGYEAASTAMRDMNLSSQGPIPDLPGGLVYRFCAGRRAGKRTV